MAIQVTDEMRVAVFTELKALLLLPSSDEARIGAEELVFDLAEQAGIIPPRLTDEQKVILDDARKMVQNIDEAEFRDWWKSADHNEQPKTAVKFIECTGY